MQQQKSTFYGRLFGIFFVFSPLLIFAQSSTWGGGVGNIIYKNCATCHHPGAIGYQQTFLDLTNELFAYNSRSSIANVVSNQSMPPWMPDPNYKHFASERVLTAAEIADIQTWAANSQYQNASPP